jgi:Transcriptional regulator
MDKTLLKGLMVLEAMSHLDGAHYTLDRIAKEVGLTRSNVHRTLQTLAHAGYVRRAPDTGAYQCTLKMFELGSRQLASFDVREIARPHMRELARLTGETVHLSVLDGFDVVYIDKIDSPQPLLAYSTIGGRAPAYAVATGKALLAFQAPDYIEHYADHLQRLTDNTRVSVPDLKRELEAVTIDGHSISRGEWREGIGGVAVPIFNGFSRGIASLGISGPLDRMTPAQMLDQALPLKRAARNISSAMGYRGDYFGIAAP